MSIRFLSLFAAAFCSMGRDYAVRKYKNLYIVKWNIKSFFRKRVYWPAIVAGVLFVVAVWFMTVMYMDDGFVSVGRACIGRRCALEVGVSPDP